MAPALRKKCIINCDTLVGEALSLPRSTGIQLPTRMGESVPARHLAPFNQTLSFVTWREAKSLPYSGWCYLQLSRRWEDMMEERRAFSHILLCFGWKWEIFPEFTKNSQIKILLTRLQKRRLSDGLLLGMEDWDGTKVKQFCHKNNEKLQNVAFYQRKIPKAFFTEIGRKASFPREWAGKDPIAKFKKICIM